MANATEVQSPESKPTARRSRFTKEEDEHLRELVARFGTNNWASIAQMMIGRNQRQCKERWENYLSPSVNYGPWTPFEDNVLRQKLAEFGPKWMRISKFFPHRTDTALKNRWLILSRRDACKKMAKKVPNQVQIMNAVDTVIPPEPLYNQTLSVIEPSVIDVDLASDTIFTDIEGLDWVSL